MIAIIIIKIIIIMIIIIIREREREIESWEAPSKCTSRGLLKTVCGRSPYVGSPLIKCHGRPPSKYAVKSLHKIWCRELEMT